MEAIDKDIQAYREAAKNSFRLVIQLRRGAEKRDRHSIEVREKEAQRHIQAMELHNSCAVSLLMEKNIYSKNGGEYFDLHGLQMMEVTSCLDMFLDSQISRFRELMEYRQNTQFLSVITGRGKHSRMGFPTVKNSAIAHFIKRKLSFHRDEYNDGLMIVLIDINSLLSSELN